jgi:hypothetical protein
VEAVHEDCAEIVGVVTHKKRRTLVHEVIQAA